MKAIENLMEKKGKFDYILLETTGLADPGPIAAMFWLDDDLGSEIYLDGKSSHLIIFNTYPKCSLRLYIRLFNPLPQFSRLAGSCSHVVLCGGVRFMSLVCDGGGGDSFLSFSITLSGWHALYNNSMYIQGSLQWLIRSIACRYRFNTVLFKVTCMCGDIQLATIRRETRRDIE